MVNVRLKPWMLKALDHLSRKEVRQRTCGNEPDTGPRSEIRHAVLLYLLSQAEAGRLPIQLVPEEHYWRLATPDWQPLVVDTSETRRSVPQQ